MYAIISESGGQRRVQQGDTFDIDLLDAGAAKPGQAVKFDKVLVVGDVGGNAKIGQPFVAGAIVTAEVIDPKALGDKVFIQKFGAKKTWRKKTGHRQQYTTVKVTAIKA